MATRIWVAGAEIDASASAALEFHTLVGHAVGGYTPFAATSDEKHSGSYSFTGGKQTQVYGIRNIPPTNQLRLGFWWYGAINGHDNQSGVVAFGSAGGECIRLSVDHINNFILEVPNGTIKDTATAVEAEVWHHLGFDIKVDEWVVVYQDGTEILRYEGSTGGEPISSILIGEMTYTIQSPWWLEYHTIPYWDDIYADDITGNPGPTPPPAYCFGFKSPNSVGFYNDLTPSAAVDHYTLVDDRPHDSDGTYVKAAGAGLKESYGGTPIIVPAGNSITAVIPTATCKKMSSADIKIKPLLRQDGTDWEGTAVATSASYDNPLFQRRTTAPGGNPWDGTNVNTVELGFDTDGTWA